MRGWRILFDGVTSGNFDMLFGVPQGSCLGPLLFVVYASKLFKIVQAQLTNAHCFVDDTQLSLSFNPNSPTDQAESVCTTKRCISDLRKLMYQNKLKINGDKTEFLIIGSQHQLFKINDCTIRVISVAVA